MVPMTNKKRAGRRFTYTFDIDRFPKHQKIAGRLQQLIVQQRNELRSKTRAEQISHELLDQSHEIRRLNFIAPRTENERQLRLEGIQKHVEIKRNLRDFLLVSICRVEAILKPLAIQRAFILSENDRVTEQNDHYDYVIQQENDIANLHQLAQKEIRKPRGNTHETDNLQTSPPFNLTQHNPFNSVSPRNAAPSDFSQYSQIASPSTLQRFIHSKSTRQDDACSPSALQRFIHSKSTRQDDACSPSTLQRFIHSKSTRQDDGCS